MRHMILPSVLVSLAACSYVARDQAQYAEDTSTLLSTRSEAVRGCYDNALASNPEASGKVVVTFNVEKKTGKITNLAVDPARTTAPESLASCVTTAIDGLTLTPEDRRQGDATFTWVFNPQAGA